MPKKIFISYSHHQGDWVWGRLAPCLKAGGAEVLIDRERFEAGKALVGQMDAIQDTADASVLVLSPEYLASQVCRHEMERAVARDPRLTTGSVISVMRRQCMLPLLLRDANPLYADLRRDRKPEPWDLLLSACDADLGTDAPHWFATRDEVRRFLERGQSVNLVVRGDGIAWRPLIADLALPGMGIVDLQKGSTASRRGLISEMLRSLGVAARVPAEPEDLAELDRALGQHDRSWLALTHFDLVTHRNFGVGLFAALRYHTMDSRKLVLLVQSRMPFAAVLPVEHPLSSIDIKIVELRGPVRHSVSRYYLNRIQLKNIRGFTSLDIQLDAPPRRQSIIIGRNGTCKTTLLRCAALVLAGGKDAPGLLSSPNGRWITNDKTEGVIRLHLESAKDGKPTIRELGIVEDNGGELIRPKEPADDMIFACAYGTGRGDFGGELGRDYRVIDSVATLFDYGERLVSSELVLRRLHDFLGSERFDAVLSGLKEALGLGPEYSIELPRGGGVEVSGPDLGGRIPLEAWSDGYRMTFSWLIDFYGWAMRAGAFDEAGNVCGILLVDELEQHLHPAMQREFLGHLEKALPKVQLIATTHSPLVALSAKPEQIVALHRGGEHIDNIPVPTLDGYSSDDVLVEKALFGTNPYPLTTEAQLNRYQELAKIPPEQRSRENADELGELARRLDPSALPALRDDPVLARLDAIAARLDDRESEA